MADKQFTFICGDDDFLVAERGRAWFAEQTAGIEDDLSKEVIDGRAGTVAEVEAALNRFSSAVQTLSLFGERKVVWLREVNFMADTQTGRAQGTQDRLEDLKHVLEGVDPDAVAVLITAHPVDKRRGFYKWCKKTAAFTVLSAETDGDSALTALLQAECRPLGVTFGRGALELLVGKVGGNTRLVVEETRKLATYLGEEGGVIDEALVHALTPNFGEADFFEAAEAFYSLKLDWALEALRRHFFTNSESRPLLANLQGRNRLMIQLRVLLDAGAIRPGGRGISQAELDRLAKSYAAHFGGSQSKSNLNLFTQHPFYLGRLAKDAARLPLRKLIDFQMAFTSAFEGILQRPNEQEEVCREMAVRCLS